VSDFPRKTVFKDISGQRFGRLTAQWPAGKSKYGTQWLCSCDCGGLTVVFLNNLGRHATSCGCFRREVTGKKNFKHGHTHNAKPSLTWRSWSSMLQRCENPNHKFFRNYGGRGITVCERWHTFENFLADMSERPVGLTLDRYPDKNGNYEPGNCRWATRQQQAKNKRPMTPEHCRNISIGKLRGIALRKLQSGKTL